jgi:uncharacterized membrane protein
MFKKGVNVMNRFVRKLLMNGIVIVPLLMWFTEATFWASIVTAAIFTTLAYFIGDQLILRMSNNTIATLSDAVLAFVYFWIVADTMDWTLTLGELFTIVVVLGIVEMIYHRQLGRQDGQERAET